MQRLPFDSEKACHFQPRLTRNKICASFFDVLCNAVWSSLNGTLILVLKDVIPVKFMAKTFDLIFHYKSDKVVVKLLYSRRNLNANNMHTGF